jgi:hypothetical protein
LSLLAEYADKQDIPEDGPRLDPALLEHLGTVAITLLGGSSVKLDETPTVSYVAQESVMGPKAKKVRFEYHTDV